MAQLEPLKDVLPKLGATLVYVAAEKRGGMFRPEKYFADHPVAFPFLLDEDRKVTKSYGVYHRWGRDAIDIARPATFVIAPDGSIGYVFVGSNQKEYAPPEEILQAIRESVSPQPSDGGKA